MKLMVLFLLAFPLFAQQQVVTLPSKSPLVNLSISFRTGAAYDPQGKFGAAALTARMLSHAGTKDMTYKQILDAFFPMATSVGLTVDKELITFSADTHIDNLDGFYKIFRSMLLEPGWRDEDFRRLKDDAINALKVGLRGNNDEELAKEVLDADIYHGTAYGHQNGGTVSSLEKIGLPEVKAFYRSHYSQPHLILGIAGGYSPAFLEGMKKDFRALPVGAGFRPRMSAPAQI
jgi:zinc protease